MNLVRYNPQRRAAVRRSKGPRFFDTVLDDFFSPFAMTHNVADAHTATSLKVDIYEKDDTLFIDAEFPGIAKEDIFVDVKGRLITLGGERKNDQEISEENSYRRERRYGKFERTFTLPFEVKSENVNASYDNGILKLQISKPEEEVTRKITIN